MRRSPAPGAGHVPAKLLLVLTLLASLVGCAPDAPVGPGGVRRIAIVLLQDTIRPGAVFQAAALALNRAGDVVDAAVRWQSLTPATLAVNAEGEVRALSPGVGRIRASVGSVTSERQVQLVNPPAATMVPSVEALTLVLPGPAVRVGVVPFDSMGIEIVGAPIVWSSDASRIATVTGSGNVTPVAIGDALLRVEVDGVAASIPVNVVPSTSATSPILSSVSPALITPGTSFTIRGSGLQPPGNATAVRVDGHPTRILSVSDTSITAVLQDIPAVCLPTEDVAVQVSTAGGVAAVSARLQLAAQRNLSVGEALILTGASDPRCLELPGDGRYLVSILNTGRAIGAGSLNLTLAAQSGLADPVSVLAPAASSAKRVTDAHLSVLEASRRAQPPRGVQSVVGAVQVAPIGELTALRVPNLDAANICTSYRAVHARTVYSGSHIYIVEDTASMLGSTPLLSGAMDAEIQALGAEIDNLLWPIITRFGNPLVMDSRLDDNNRVVVALTPELNAMQGGAVFGAVVTCDFYARSQFPASNVGEIVYLQVPTLAGEGDAATVIARWRHQIRGTVAHELKHVVSFGEHIVRNLPLEETWLEEATAQHAEELYTRALTGATATGNTAYAAIRCEILAAQGDGNCAGTPAMMKPTFDGLWDFLSASASRSPLGSIAVGDFSFYGSGWSLLRWAMDHSATPEASFTQQLTVSGQSGVANLEARAGLPWEQMLARWSLALATDGTPRTSPSDATLRFPSWDLGSVFDGLCADLGPCGGSLATGSRYVRAHPLQPLAPPGNFLLTTVDLAPAGFQVVEVSPSVAGPRRFIQLTAANGATPPNTARLAILRIN